MKKEFTLPDGETLYLEFLKYQNGRLALELSDSEGDPYAVISVNLPEYPDLPKNYMYVKNWSENQQIVEDMVKLGILEDTEFPAVPSGMVMVPVYRINSEYVPQ